MSVSTAPLEKPPEDFRPDRQETMAPRGSGPQIEIARGVHLDWQVGQHINARNLTTGLVTFERGARLDYHTHPCSESITVLEGSALVCVEERQYQLLPYDNVTIPAGKPHAAYQVGDKPALLHVALASEAPPREPAEGYANLQEMPRETQTHPRGERATFFDSAHHYSPGPAADFVDYFNASLIPGCEMSGGFGKFGNGGRLPAHIHDFDESICIVEGQAVCMVEGREYAMDGRATALQPRGRVHYFINRSGEAMAMIWVYAGPMPERIVVEERCGNEPGAAWGEEQ